MMNLEMKQFEQQIINVTNASPLPIEAKRLIISDVLQKIEKVAEDQIQKEFAAWQQEKARKEEKDASEDHGESESVEDQQKGE